LYFPSTLLIKLLCVTDIDLLDLFLIISTPRNSFISPRLLISSLEISLRSLYRSLTRSLVLAKTSISSTCVARTIGLFLCIKTLLSIFKLIKSSFSR
jgi:hypothetical protein